MGEGGRYGGRLWLIGEAPNENLESPGYIPIRELLVDSRRRYFLFKRCSCREAPDAPNVLLKDKRRETTLNVSAKSQQAHFRKNTHYSTKGKYERHVQTVPGKFPRVFSRRTLPDRTHVQIASICISIRVHIYTDAHSDTMRIRKDTYMGYMHIRIGTYSRYRFYSTSC